MRLESLPLEVLARSSGCEEVDFAWLGAATRRGVDLATGFRDATSGLEEMDFLRKKMG